MAENTYKSNTFKKPEKEKRSKASKGGSRFNLDFFRDPRLHLAVGFFLLITSLFLFTAFVSYLFTGKADQSVVEALGDSTLVESGKEAENWLGLYGAFTPHCSPGHSPWRCPARHPSYEHARILDGRIFFRGLQKQSRRYQLLGAGGAKHCI